MYPNVPIWSNVGILYCVGFVNNSKLSKLQNELNLWIVEEFDDSAAVEERGREFVDEVMVQNQIFGKIGVTSSRYFLKIVVRCKKPTKLSTS
eukprot:SAG31_NODE_2251_length_6082_cov_2.050643_6_plen_92_part_00